MKILVIGDSEENHISKYHEAFRRGLVRLYNATLYGKGYPGFDPELKSYKQILAKVYPDGGKPDLLLASYNLATSLEKMTFEYGGLEEVDCPKAIILSDWWNITDHFKDDYPAWLQKYGITYVLCQHQAPLRIYAQTAVAERFVHFPACVDPELLNDWELPKVHDVGFLGCGIAPFDAFYPERQAIHKALLTQSDLKYFWKPHPGYNPLPQDHPLVGRNFSKAINQCRMFIVTGSRLNNTFGKYFEVPASGSLMLATEPEGADVVGLVDGVNYIKITPEDVLAKVDYYLKHPDEARKITHAGYRWAMARHSIYARSQELYELARKASRPTFEPADVADDYGAGRYQKVLDRTDRILAASPNPIAESYTHYLRGHCLAQLGKQTESAGAFKTELSYNTGGQEALAGVLPFASEAELMQWFHLPGSFNRHLPLIYSIAVASKAQRVVDMGIGFSTRTLRTAMQRTGGVVYSCDYARDRFAHFLPHQTAQWKLALEPSEKFLNRLEGPIDFALHDAAHDYKQVKRDLELLIPRMRRFAFIAIHDTQQYELNQEMMAAIHDAIKPFQVSLTTMPYCCGLTLLRMEEANFSQAITSNGAFDRNGRNRMDAPLPHALKWDGTLRDDRSRRQIVPLADGTLKLNVGCGQDYQKGYVNLDVAFDSKADVVCSYMELQDRCKPGSVDEIRFIQAINYVPLWEARRLLATCFSLLKPGAKLIIETANVETLCKKVLDNIGNFDEYLEGIRAMTGFGLDHLKREERYTGLQLGWGAWHLTRELQQVGFSRVDLLPPTTHSHWRDMRLEAMK